jgi:AmpE protein
MAWTVMAVVLALFIGHSMPQISQWRNYSWFARWLKFLQSQLLAQPFWQSGWGLAVCIGVPALAVGLPGFWLSGVWAFLVALAVLLYTWGPRDLDLDVNAIIQAEGLEAKELAARALYEEGQAVSLEGPVAVAAVFENALTRWFAVLFWFLLFGPLGAAAALAYRLLYLLVHHKHALALPDGLREAAAKTLNAVHCPPAHVMVFSMALAANFDSVIQVWRQWYNQGGPRWDYGFLAAAANASVASELAEEAADADDGPASAPALLELRDAMSLAWRMLLLWLAVLAVFVLAGLVK